MTKENWEYSWRDYYEILQLHPSAETEVIKAAYLKLVQKYNTDQHTAKSEQKWKDLNEAFEILGNPDKKRLYDIQYSKKKPATNNGLPISSPKPAVRPSFICIEDAVPGETKKAILIIRNIGGPFSKVFLSKSNSWMKIVLRGPLSDTTKLPFQIGLELTGEGWGKSYSDNIIVKLDNEETHVHVELKTVLQPKESISGKKLPPPPEPIKTGTKTQQNDTPVDYSYIPQKEVEGQINLFAQTRCSYCSNYAGRLIDCPPRKVVSNCINFKSMSGEWHHSKLKEQRYWPWISFLLKPYIKGNGFMARCTDIKCLALNPTPRDTMPKCWKCGGNTLICPKHSEIGRSPILKYDVGNHEWKCPDEKCGYHVLLPKDIWGYELIGLKYPKNLEDLKSKYANDNPRTPPKPTDSKPKKKPHWW